MVEVERLAPEGRHRVEVDEVDENTVNGERHPAILAADDVRLSGSFRVADVSRA
jgi:hypothetical protein